MKMLRFVATLALVLAGMTLLWTPCHAQTRFAPTRFTVTDQGTAGKPDIILIPGLASSRAVWDGEAAKLTPNYRLHLVQVNGFAGQPAGVNAGSTDLLQGIVEELHEYIVGKNMHPDVIGHSMGGTMALMLAERHPADVHKLVLVDALPFLGALYSADATVESVKPIAEGEKAQMAMITDTQYAATAPQFAAAMVSDSANQALVTQMSVSSDRKVVAEALYEDLLTDLRPGLPMLVVPTLLLYPYDAGSQGPDPAKVDALYKGQYKSATTVQLVRVDNSHHFIMYDQPAKLNSALEAFLK